MHDPTLYLIYRHVLRQTLSILICKYFTLKWLQSEKFDGTVGAQSASLGHQSSKRKVVGSSPGAAKNFSFGNSRFLKSTVIYT